MKRWPLLIIACLFVACSNENTNKEDANKEAKQKEVQAEEEKELERNAAALEIYEALKEVDKELFYDKRYYTEGTIPEGEYAYISFIDSGGPYFTVTDMEHRLLHDDYFASFAYIYHDGEGIVESEGYLFHVDIFEELGVSGAKELYEILNHLPSYNQDAYYHIGMDIEEGKYRLIPDGNGTYELLDGPAFVGEEIEEGKVTERMEIEVENGQYLRLKNTHILPTQEAIQEKLQELYQTFH